MTVFYFLSGLVIDQGRKDGFRHARCQGVLGFLPQLEPQNTLDLRQGSQDSSGVAWRMYRKEVWQSGNVGTLIRS